MEAFDISNISGVETVGSMIVYENGKPKRNAYRKFKIRTVKGQDDYRCMEEVLTRRFQHGLEETVSGEEGKFSDFPDVLMMDGGKGQVNVAIARAYAVNPSVLLMDEPFGALDAQTRTQLQTELLKTWQEENKTCFFVTHDIEEAIVLASRVVIMSARPGRIKEIIDIDIPHPRDQATKMSPRFVELKNYIWSQVYQEYLEVQK